MSPRTVPRQRRRRQVVAAGVAPGAESPSAGVRGRRLTSSAVVRVCVVGAQHPDRRGDAGGGERGELQRRHPGVRTRLAPTAGEVHMPVDEAGNDAQSTEIDLGHTERRRDVREPGSHGDNRSTSNEHVLAAEPLRSIQLRLAEGDQR